MVKRLLFFIGLVLLAPLRASAADTLYEQIKKFTEHQFMQEEMEPAINAFIRTLVKVDPQLSEDEVNALLRGEMGPCTEKKVDDNPLDQTSCVALQKRISALARQEERIRTLGRDLQLIASGYEMPIGDYPGKMVSIPPRFRSIITVWQSSNDWATTPVVERKVRTVGYPDGIEEDISSVESALYELQQQSEGGDNVLSAAVWRYRHGLRQVQNEEGGTSCENLEAGDGTELQYVRARWCALEDALEYLLVYIIKNTTYDPPLEYGEVAIFPTWLFKELGILVWVRTNFTPPIVDDGEDDEEDGEDPTIMIDPSIGDIGLEWEFPIEPVLPSLDCSQSSPKGAGTVSCKDNIIIGGIYPEPPQEPGIGAKLCSHPFSSQGYLCRPLDLGECPMSIEEEEQPNSPSQQPKTDTGGILLTRCYPRNMKELTRQTLSGPNACEVGGWRLDEPTINGEPFEDSPEKDLDAEDLKDAKIPPDKDFPLAFDCGNCSVDIYCGDCPEGLGGGTFPKNELGVIPICLSNKESSAALKYLLMHELVHAQQRCNQQSVSIAENLKECCSIEHDAYLILCNAMANDGIFDGTDITMDLCSSVLSNYSCKKYWKEEKVDDKTRIIACTDMDDKAELEMWNGKIGDAIVKNGASAAESCDQVVNSMDIRARQQINSLQLACKPDCPAQYNNTIGNNACYIAQCTEQTLETERLLPGRITYVSEGESYPWDSTTPEDPLIGSLLPVPPVPLTRFPTYEPERVVKDLELALCQANGYPIQNPPHECSYDLLRGVSFQLPNAALTGSSWMRQFEEQERAALGLQGLAQGMGARLGTNLFAQYLDRSGRTFWELITDLNQIVGGIADIEFPDTMCARYRE